MSNRLRGGGVPLAWILALSIGILAAGVAGASDQEGCLLCHRLELRVAADGAEKILKVHDSPDWIHKALYCSDCHPDARTAPHPLPPGTAQCIGECHGGTDDATASHRRAAYAGFTESHRRVSPGRSPCRICHFAADRKGNRPENVRRCVACHRKDVAAAGAGPHATFAGSARFCVDCHPAHPEGVVLARNGGASCGATGCHARVAPGLRALADHRGGDRKSRGVGRTLLFFLLAFSGWTAGRLLSPPPAPGGDRS